MNEWVNEHKNRNEKKRKYTEQDLQAKKYVWKIYLRFPAWLDTYLWINQVKKAASKPQNTVAIIVRRRRKKTG